VGRLQSGLEMAFGENCQPYSTCCIKLTRQQILDHWSADYDMPDTTTLCRWLTARASYMVPSPSGPPQFGRGATRPMSRFRMSRQSWLPCVAAWRGEHPTAIHLVQPTAIKLGVVELGTVKAATKTSTCRRSRCTFSGKTTFNVSLFPTLKALPSKAQGRVSRTLGTAMPRHFSTLKALHKPRPRGLHYPLTLTSDL
jgi:hypothetical protein